MNSLRVCVMVGPFLPSLTASVPINSAESVIHHISVSTRDRPGPDHLFLQPFIYLRTIVERSLADTKDQSYRTNGEPTNDENPPCDRYRVRK